MRLKPIVTALCAGALLAASPFASAKELKAIGVTVGDLANPFFVQITKGSWWWRLTSPPKAPTPPLPPITPRRASWPVNTLATA